MENNNHKEKSITELRQNLQGKVLQPADEDYTEGKEIWNGAVNAQPALIIIPETAADVQTAVRYAREHDMPLSVLGGGHDWAGRALNQNGVVISLRKLKKMQIDPEGRVARVDGGITSGELIAAADPYGLVAVTGSMGIVGFAGLTLGGGYGPLSPSYGLAIDNLLGVEIVLPDGSLVKADATENPDLFWALKGGGGNFGVVTSLTVKLHQAKPILAGMILFSMEEAETVLKSHNINMQNAPDALSVLAGITTSPEGGHLLFLAPTWCGDLKEGEEQMASMQKFGAPVLTQIAPMRYKDVIAIFDEYLVNGASCEIQTRWLPELTDHAISTIINAGHTMTSKMSLINMHHFHGASTRVNLPDTAFGLRQPHFMLEMVAVWNKDAGDEIHQQWTRNFSAALIDDSLPGGYANLLGPDEHEQIANAYGENLERLQQIKRKYDPANVFKGISIYSSEQAI